MKADGIGVGATRRVVLRSSSAVSAMADPLTLTPEELALVGGDKLRALLSRLFSALFLAAVLLLLARGGWSVYRAFTDAFVAPIILSPNNDSVIQSKLTLSHVVADRSALISRLEQGRVLLAADEKAFELFKGLSPTMGTPDATSGYSAARSGQRRASLSVLDAQRLELEHLLHDQERYVADLERDVASGLVRKVDLERERSKLAEARVQLLENQRESHAGREQLANIGADDVRSTLEYFKLQADHAGRVAEQSANQEALANLDQLLAQMRERPIFRATEGNQNVAFVPYAQLDGVKRGGVIYQCSLWGFFGCSAVGKVSEVLAGEVVSPEPWGGESRGQYALLELTQPAAARARSLRVRDPSAVALNALGKKLLE